MHRLPQSNSLPELNKTFRDLYRRLACLVQTAGFQFLFGSGDPVDDITGKGVYLNTDNNELWEYNSGWTMQATLGGGSGTNDLQTVLDAGNIAVDQDISLVASNSDVTGFIAAGPTNEAIQMAVENGEPFLRMQTQLLASVNIRANLVGGSNNEIELPANSGTLALLSDIPPATPTVISTKTTSYTLQLSDADFDTLFEMDAATDEDFIVDSAEAFPIGTSFIFARRGLGEVNIVATGSTVILSANGATNLTYQDSGATLIKVSATEWYLFGDIGTPSTSTPGGNNREIQFNDGGTLFGGATNFTYDPGNTNGLVELSSTDDTKSVMSIQGPATSTNIFEVSDQANPGVGNYFIVGANQGSMYGLWTISNGGKLTISTSTLGLNDMFVLNNSAGTRNMAFSLSNDNTFAIRDVQASVNRIEVSPTGDVAIKALDTDSSAPSTTGTVKMVVCDNTGKLSNKPDPRPYQVLFFGATSSGTSITFTQFENTTGVTYTATRTSDGLYSLTADSGTPFTANKTFVFIGPADPTGTLGADQYHRDYFVTSTTVIEFATSSLSNGLQDEVFNNTPIEIRIYP